MKKSINPSIFGNSNNISKYLNIGIPPWCAIKSKLRLLMVTLFYTFIYCLSFYAPNMVSAQVIHQSFEIGERKAVTLSIDVPYKVETWAGNTILTETKVDIQNLAPNILKHLIDKGRYKIIENLSDSAIELTLKEANRRPIRVKSGEAIETIKVKVFVPEDCIVDQRGKGQAEVEQTGER